MLASVSGSSRERSSTYSMASNVDLEPPEGYVEVIATQSLDSKPVTAVDMMQKLSRRKSASEHDQSSVWSVVGLKYKHITSDTEPKTATKYAVMYCLCCKQEFGAGNKGCINPSNIAKTHFRMTSKNKVPSCVNTHKAAEQISSVLGKRATGGQSAMTTFVTDTMTATAAKRSCALYFFTSNTAFNQVKNPHLAKAFAQLGCNVPTSWELKNTHLPAARKQVHEHVLESMKGKRYALVTDGWSKKTAVRGEPLINVMCCPDTGPAVFIKIVNAAGEIKNIEWVYQLHKVRN